MQVPSLDRPVPLLQRADLKFERIELGGRADYVVKDPLRLQYFRLLPEQQRLLELLDGQRSLRDLCRQLRVEFPAAAISLHGLQSLLIDLHQKELVWSSRLGQGAVYLQEQSTQWLRRMRSLPGQLLYLRLPGCDPTGFLRWFNGCCGWLLSAPVIVLWLGFIAWSWLFALTHADAIHRELPTGAEFFSGPNVLALWLTVGAAKVIHELGHGLACHRLGGECHEIGVAFLMLSPCLYCDVSDAWMLPRKRDRIMVAAAGVFAELGVSACALMLWSIAADGPFRALCLNVFLVTTIAQVIWNANPLMRYDGYYILSDWLDVPNLRQTASRLLLRLTCRLGLGIRPSHDPFLPEAGRTWFALYGLVSLVYRWSLVVSIGLFIHYGLQPLGLQNLSAVYVLFTVAGAAVAAGATAAGVVHDNEGQPVSWTRFALLLATVSALGAAALQTPLTDHASAPVILEPADAQPVFTKVAGTLIDVHVTAGQLVAAGDVLAQLTNTGLDRARIDHDEALRLQRVEIAVARALDDSGRETLAADGLRTVVLQVEAVERQYELLTIVAPISGTVVAPPAAVAASAARSQSTSARSTEPLSEQNLGCEFPTGTPLCGICPTNRWQAQLYVDPAEFPTLAIGDAVTVRVETFPTATLTGRLIRLSAGESRRVPSALSQRYGGSLPTQLDESGADLHEQSLAQATVLLDAFDLPVAGGMRGTAKFQVPRRTLGSVAWDFIQRELRRL